MSLCIGLTAWLREKRSAALVIFGEVCHLPENTLVRAIQLGLAGWAAPPLLKFAVVTLTGIPLAFLVGGLLHRLLRV